MKLKKKKKKPFLKRWRNHYKGYRRLGFDKLESLRLSLLIALI